MKTIVAAVILNSLVAAGLVVASHPANATVPCEEMLKSMRALKATAHLSVDDKQKADDLETKAVERCNADDDTRSDAFLTEAMKILGK
jgi:surface antigen